MTRTLVLLCWVWVLAVSGWGFAEAQFNNPEGVDIWCGKAYRPANASFNPGGWFEDPPKSDVPLLNLRVRPRMSIYLETDEEASLLVDAGISDQIGQPLPYNYTVSTKYVTSTLSVDILVGNTTVGNTSISIGSTDVEVPIDLRQFTAGLDGIYISIKATLGGAQTYEASTELFKLPSPEGYGSVSRLDNLYGGLWVQRDGEAWQHIFPYTYYVQWSLYWDDNVTTLNDYAALGYNMIHIVPTGTLQDQPFPWDQFEAYLDRADELGLYLQYDVIWEPDNLTRMIEQVERIRSHRSLLVWYQSDEPDGKSNPINSTGIAYDKIRELDPYHPASLALNCYDFYYSDYAKGADIILPDVYPISVNTSYSDVYGTVCNAIYGCCGCDDCDGAFEDISDRLDEFRRRDDLIGWSKTQWFAPQAFGNETFWKRYPTAAEEVVMTLLAINHGAKGIVMWDYPTTAELLNVTNHLASVLTNQSVADFLLGAPLTQTLEVSGASRVDAAVWVSADTSQALLSVVNLNYGDIKEMLQVAAPNGTSFTSVTQTLWGDLSWDVEDDQTLSSSGGMLGLQVSVLLLEISAI
ncbi:putative Glycoside hydrolase subgroup catalytic core [Seiridium cardinale]|uniref:Glycoside hydrolase subgroup catalytic core n=1 Tax=Seiridium cardinale TaxID=138064 RepID=A0ABR2XUX0_9PEZI